MKKVSKKEASKEIEEFFSNIRNKSPLEIKKIKRIAMKHNIRLREKKKMFCKKCLNPYKNPKIRVRKRLKLVECAECGNKSRWKIKLF